jgi:hypothetical protein
MNGYHVDWIGALSAGAVSAIVFLLIKRAFPRLTGATFLVVLGLVVAIVSLVFRELLRRIGI